MGADRQREHTGPRHLPVKLALFGVFVLAYFAVYYSSPAHWRDLATMFIPDELFRQWVGGDISRFGILDRIPVLGLAILILLAAYTLGRFVLEALHAERILSRLENVLFAIGIGLNLLSLVTLAVGLAGLLHQAWLFYLLLAALPGLALWRWRPVPRAWLPPRGTHRAPLEAYDWLDTRLLWIAAPLLVLIVLGGMLPPWHFDVREYHLQVPKEWYLQGRVDFLPHNVYGNMPLGAEMHALLAMALLRDWWWGALVGKTVIASFAPLTALLLLAAGRRFANTTVGVVAAIVFLSTPWVARLSIAGLIDVVVAFYLFAAFYAVLLWTHHSTARIDSHAATGASADASAEDAGRRPLAMIWVGGLLAGGAVACKYPALVFAALPLAAWLVLHRTAPAEGERRRVKLSLNARAATVFLLAVFASSGLWFAKNLVFTGNPTYPLLYNVFGGATRTAEKDQQWRSAHAVPPREQLEKYWLRQIRALSGLQDGEASWLDNLQPVLVPLAHVASVARRVLWRNELLSPILVPLALLGVFIARARPLTRPTLLMFLYVIAAWWLLTHRIDRFWVPAIPLASLLAGSAAAWTTAPAWRYLLVGLLCWASLFGFLASATREMDRDNRFLVALDDLREDIPRANDYRLTRIHPAHRYLNEHVPLGYRVLMVGDAQPFDLDVPVLYNTCFDDCLFERLMKGRSRAERLEALRQAKISHVYIHWSEIARYRQPGNYGYSDYITRQLVYGELVREQGLLRPIIVDEETDTYQVFEVVGVPR